MKKLLITCLLLLTFHLSLVPLSFAATDEESAVYKLNQGSLPEQAITNKPQAATQDLFTQIWDELGKVKDQLLGLFIAPPADTTKLFSQSESIIQSDLPEQLLPKDTDSVVEQQKKFLGTPNGEYGLTLPEFPISQDIPTKEKAFDHAYFPCDQGVCPVTP